MTPFQNEIEELKSYLSSCTPKELDWNFESGVVCSYKRSTSIPSIGFKIYRNGGQYVWDNSIQSHRKIAVKYGLAPLIFGSFSVEQEDYIFRVLLVEHVTIIKYLSWDEYDKVYSDFIDFLSQMRDICNSEGNELGRYIKDDHRGNFGMRGNKFLMTDFSI